MTKQEARSNLFQSSLPFLFLLYSLSLGAIAFGQSKDDKEVFASVNDRKITGKEVDELLGSQIQELQEKIYFIRKTATNNLIIRVLLEEEA